MVKELSGVQFALEPYDIKVWLETKLDDTKSYQQFLINVALNEDLRKNKKLVNLESYPFSDFVYDFGFWDFAMVVILKFVTGSFKM